MDYPALALLEFDGIASGLKTADAMLKQSPIAVLKCGTVHPGNYLVMIGGTVGSCQEAYQHGLNIAAKQVTNPEQLASLHNGLGVAWLSEDKFEQGKSAFQQAMLLNPDDANYRSNLALCWLLSGDIKQARIVFTPLLSYQKLPAQVEMNFALLLLAENKEQQARQVLSRYLSSSQIDQDIQQLKKGLQQ